MANPAARSDLNQAFRPTKSRRLVSAWMVNNLIDETVSTVGQFQDLFDQVVFMCGGTKADGSLPTEWPVAQRKELNKRFRDLGVSTLNDYGGGAKDGGVEVLKSEKLMGETIKRMLDECDQVGNDGIDIDFEHLPADKRFGFSEFMARLSEELHRRNKMLSVCVYALSPEARRETGVGFWETSTLAGYVDQMRAMTYDLYCPPSQFVGPTSTAPWGRETMTYMSTQVPRHKIVMGLPTYSVDWDIVAPENSTQVQDYKWIAEREKESPIGRGWCYYWDVGLIRFNDEKGHAHLLYVSDARSTKSHLVTVDSLDLSGISFWHLNGADPKIWECVREHFRRWG
jgi:spore germination protein YaaH